MWAGLGVLGVAWAVVPWVGLPPFTAHMLMHMLVVAGAAPLLAGAVAGSRWDPVARCLDAGRAGWMAPVVASMVEGLVVWGWHAPVLHHAARHHVWARVAEQGSFLLAASWLWCAALGGGAARRRARATGGVTGLLLTSMHMTLLGALITLSGRELYGSHGMHGMGDGMGGLSALHDQQLGGAVMLVMGGVAYLAGGLWLAADVFRGRREVAR